MAIVDSIWKLQWAWYLLVLSIVRQPSPFLFLITCICGASAFKQIYQQFTVEAEKKRNRQQGLTDFTYSQYAAQSKRHAEKLQKLGAGTLDDATKEELVGILRDDEDLQHARMEQLLREIPINTKCPNSAWATILRATFAFLGAQDAVEPMFHMKHNIVACPDNTELDCSICAKSFVQGCSLAILHPCEHIFHQKCWHLWSLFSGMCPVCGQAQVTCYNWQTHLLAGEVGGAVRDLCEEIAPFYLNYLPIIKNPLWKVLIRLYWLIATLQRILFSKLGLCFSLSLVIECWRYYGLSIAIWTLMPHATVAVLSLLVVGCFWTETCRTKEPALYKAMKALRNEVAGDQEGEDAAGNTSDTVEQLDIQKKEN